MDSKICTKCKVLKSLDEFGQTNRGKNGYKSQCYDCGAAYIRGKRKEPTFRAKEFAYQLAYCEKHGITREELWNKIDEKRA